jgi:hypothetical protein
VKRLALLALAIACAPRVKPAPAAAVVVDVAPDGAMKAQGQSVTDVKQLPAGTELVVRMSAAPEATRKLQFLVHEAKSRGCRLTATVTSREKPFDPTLEATMSGEGHVTVGGKSSKPQLVHEILAPEACAKQGVRLTGGDMPEISATLAVVSLARAGCDVVLVLPGNAP